MVILDTCATAHVTVALTAVTRRMDTVLVGVLLAGRVATVRQVDIIVVVTKPRAPKHYQYKENVTSK